MAQSNQSPFEVKDFSGGITDDVYDQNYTQSTELDNFTITSDAKPLSRPGSTIDDETNDQIPDGVERVGALINYANNDTLLVQSGTNIYFRDPSAYTTIQGPSSNDVFSAGDFDSAVSFSQWNRHLFVTNDSYPHPMKIYKDDNGDIQVRNSGLPGLATAPIVTAGAVGTREYIYAFHYEYTYMVGDQEFQDVGPVTFVELSLSGDPSSSANPISVIPVISNGGSDNYDTAAIKVVILRTIDAGQTLYRIGDVTNGTTTFNDNVSDATAQDGDVLYTDDGTLEFDPPPQSKYVHVVNNTGYYLNLSDGSETFPYRLRQSVPGDPDSCPEDFAVDLEDEGFGMSSVKSVPIAFCKKYIYRIENGFDQFGRGFMNPIRISDTVGCISNLSIVQAENFVFWAGVDGFYATDGYQITKLSDHINTRYKNTLAEQDNAAFVYGKYDEKERRIYWAVQSDSSSLDNDSLIVLDLRWGIKPEACFTTWSGNSFRPTSLEFFNGFLYRGDMRGYVFKHDPDVLTDPKVDTNEDAADWNLETIIWTNQSININFGSTFFRKMPTRILLTAANIANTSIQISAINDAGRSTRNMTPIRWLRNFTWGDANFVWGNPDCVWAGVGIIEQWRRFPARGLRLSYLSLVVTNAFAIVINSDTLGSAAFSGAANTVTLGGANEWPTDSVDYVITTSDDDYSREFTVLDIPSAGVLHVSDPNGVFPTGNFEWELKGFRKGEPLNLLSYNVFWEPIGQSQMTYESGQSGANA